MNDNLSHKLFSESDDDTIDKRLILNDENWKKVVQKFRNVQELHEYYGHPGINKTRMLCVVHGLKFVNLNYESCICMNNGPKINHVNSVNTSLAILHCVRMDLCQPYGRLQGFDG